MRGNNFRSFEVINEKFKTSHKYKINETEKANPVFTHERYLNVMSPWVIKVV